MIPFEIGKYGFRIRTRGGVTVDNLSIHAGNDADACRKLQQMYPGCQILETWHGKNHLGGHQASFEEIIDLITPAHH